MSEPPADDLIGDGRLLELAVADLGVIEDMRLVLGPGMTALTGETGAGKTMVVGAIDLLTGGRADAGLVRPGADEAVVEGRFEVNGDEVVLSRVIPADGRSRAYVNGRMATVGSLGGWGGRLVDLHGQHDHQSLLSPAVQRAALDRYGDVDLAPLTTARDELRRIAAELDALGGDTGALAREADLLRFQLTEIDAAGLADPAEDVALDAEEDRLAGAVAHREAAAAAVELLAAEGAAGDRLGEALAALDGRAPFTDAVVRLRSAAAELADVASDLRTVGETIEEDPERLAAVRERRQLIVDLRRKYGTATLDGATAAGGTLGDVLAYRDAAAVRLAAIEGHDDQVQRLEADRERARQAEARAAAAVAAARRKAAPDLATDVQTHLRTLAMPKARIEVSVEGPDPADDVRFLLAANPGAPPQPLAKVASGGELARAMLALRLVLRAAPPVLVFDEVDAGVGGAAAIEVGRALAALGGDHQVLVVTHLPQVAAFADTQVTVTKRDRGGATVSQAATLGPEERIVELSRMLSGTPDSERVRQAASELLATAAEARGR